MFLAEIFEAESFADIYTDPPYREDPMVRRPHGHRVLKGAERRADEVIGCLIDAVQDVEAICDDILPRDARQIAALAKRLEQISCVRIHRDVGQ